MRRFLVGVLLSATISGAPAAAREETLDLGFLFIGGRQAFALTPLPGLPVQKRAMQIRTTLLSMIQKSGTIQPFKPEEVSIEESNGIRLTWKGLPVATVTDQDARKLRISSSELAFRWAENLRMGLSTLKVGASVPGQFVLLKDRQGRTIPLGLDSLAAEVMAALSMAPDLKKVQATGLDGVVVLSGQVSTLFGREQAEALASQVPGIRDIRNWIEVVAPPVPDEPLLEAIKKRLYLHLLTREANLQITTEGGIVVLSGTAPSMLVADLAEELTGRVQGVGRIENRIEVKPEYQRADGDIRQDLLSRLEGNGAIRRAASLEVTVLNGAVTIKGTADSLMVRQTALDEARRISGVVEIEDRIEVCPP
ncbi:MAG: BON domain-containing protein [Bacteroidota bacterium]